MYELFQMSPQETRMLLSIIRSGGMFNAGRAAYWPCTHALLSSDIYRKIESAVEERLGRPVYFLFDELFTPHPGANFELFHKDIEDENFEGGCWNVWIPLYSSGEKVSQLEIVMDEVLSTFQHALPPGERWVSTTTVNDGELLFVNRNGSLDEQRVSDRELQTKVVGTSTKRNTVHVFNSSNFHRGVPTQDFNIRFGIKFSTVPYSRTRNQALDILTFGYWYRTLERDMPAFAHLAQRERHYEVAKTVHEKVARKMNETTEKDRVLYEALFDSLLQSSVVN